MRMTTLDANYDPASDGALRTKGAPVPRPRNAATLILVRRDAATPQVLMGRRNRGHDFMPDKWVFPGGRVDRADVRALAAAVLRPDVAAKLALTARRRPALPRALALAAIRETWEETGLLLAKPGASRPGAGPWRSFLERGAAPDLSALTFVARAITPPYRPKRFDALVFIAEAESLISLDRAPDCGELDEIACVSMDDALGLDLPNITRFVLGDIAQRLDEPGRPIPFMRFTKGARRLEHL